MVFLNYSLYLDFMKKFEYKMQTVLMICILGFSLFLVGCNLKENESVFDFLEKKQTGLGYIPPLFFFGFIRYRKKESQSLVD
jgi:hypothetical protein